MNMEMPQENKEEGEGGLERIQLLKEEFHRIKTGEVTYGGVVREDLQKTLEENEEEISHREGKEIQHMVEIIPVLELRNLMSQIHERIADEDLMTAKSLHAEAEELLHAYEGEVMSKLGLDTLALDLQEIGDNLYS